MLKNQGGENRGYSHVGQVGIVKLMLRGEDSKIAFQVMELSTICQGCEVLNLNYE